MVKFLALQVLMGNITIDEVPEKWREAVKKELEKMNGEE